MPGATREQIIGMLVGMSDGQLEHLLDAAHVQSAGKRRGASVGELVAEFGGSIPEEELDRLEKVIEEDCERIAPDR